MNDTISRRGAIKAIKDALLSWSNMPEWRENKIVDALDKLPSAQPVAKDINVPCKDCISRQAAIDMLKNRWKRTRNYEGVGDDIAEECELYLKQVPPAQPVPTYQTCSDALLKMWMDNVLTDSEYNRIMDKLNAWKGNPNADHN